MKFSFPRTSGAFKILCPALVLAVASQAQPGYVSPLTGSLNTHDPVIMKQDSIYYLFHTGNGAQIKRSTNRVHWETGSPDRVIPQGGNPEWQAKYSTANSMWAPAIAHWGGKYWLYYSMSNFGSRRSAIGLRTNTTLHQDDPAYEWVDQGMVVCTYDNATTHPECFHAPTQSVTSNNDSAFNAIDPDIFIDDDGSIWLSFGSFGAGIQLIRLNPETGKPYPPEMRPFIPGSERRTIAHRYHTPAGSGYFHSIEAPVITKHGPWYYLWYSHDRCCNSAGSTYKIKVTRADNVMGPYFDKDSNMAHPPYRAGGATTGTWQAANAGTLVSQGDSINWAATGHNDIFVDNDTVFLVNHGYTWPQGQTRLMIRPLYWDEDGWPTLDSTQGVITAPVDTSVVSVRGAPAHGVAPTGRGKPLHREGGSLLVPWEGGVRDLLGRDPVR